MDSQEWTTGPCDICMDSGKDPKNRKRPCPTCEGRGRPFCQNCWKPLPCGGVKAVDGPCEVDPILSERGLREILVFKVCEDGHRLSTRIRDLRTGDRFHKAGPDWRQVQEAIGSPYRCDTGIWVVSTHPVARVKS